MTFGAAVENLGPLLNIFPVLYELRLVDWLCQSMILYKKWSKEVDYWPGRSASEQKSKKEVEFWPVMRLFGV
jgi:hypothetical protein